MPPRFLYTYKVLHLFLQAKPSMFLPLRSHMEFLKKKFSKTWKAKKEAFLDTYGVYDSDSSDIETCGFDGTYTEPMPGGVTLIYGYVTFTDTYAGAFDVQSTCAAVIASHHYGRTFYSVDSTAYAFASNSGAWDFDSVSCQVNSSNTSVTISYNGVIDCPYDVAVSLGVSDFFGFEAGMSTTVHGRQYVSNANTYTC